MTNEQLRAEGEWFYQLLLTHGDGHNAALRFGKALNTRELAYARLYRYAKTAWDDGMSPPPPSLTGEDKRRAGEYLVELRDREQNALAVGRKSRGNEVRVEFGLTSEESRRLDRYCRDYGAKRAEATRTAYQLLPGWNEPLE